MEATNLLQIIRHNYCIMLREREIKLRRENERPDTGRLQGVAASAIMHNRQCPAGNGAETIDIYIHSIGSINNLDSLCFMAVYTKNVLGTMMHSFASMAIIGVIWMVCGYSMCFGENVLGGWFGWNPDYFLLGGIDESISGGIPEYVFAMFQCMFAMITPALIAGAFADDSATASLSHSGASWSTIRSAIGFGLETDSYTKRAIDFAGGTVIHISAGAAALVCTLSWRSTRISKNGVTPITL